MFYVYLPHRTESQVQGVFLVKLSKSVWIDWLVDDNSCLHARLSKLSLGKHHLLFEY